MQRIVIRTPLQEIWNSSGDVKASRRRYVGKEDIRKLLQNSAIEFIVANVGDELRWIPKSECFDFWKKEVFAHLSEPEIRIDLDQYPDQYCYSASVWGLPNGEEIILLEKYH